MAHYVHHVPGRLRVKTAGLKKNEAQAARIQLVLEEAQGVLSHEVNTITGSILVNYDVNATDSDTIMALLKNEGYVDPEASVQRSANPARNSNNKLAGSIGKAVFGVVVEKVVERSAVALIGAVL